jgi:hypothetical protein
VKKQKGKNAPVAQLDRALPSEGRGQGFESLRARQISNKLFAFGQIAKLTWQADSQQVAAAWGASYHDVSATASNVLITDKTKLGTSEREVSITTYPAGARSPRKRILG